MEKKKVGIVGLGVVGKRLLHSFTAEEQTDIQCVCDIHEEVAERAASEFGVPHYVTDYKELVSRSDIDLVYVAVPPAYHYDVVMSALDHNKHVLCEKPLANSLNEANEMLEKAKEEGLVHAMHFPLPYSLPFVFVKEQVEEGKLGDIVRVNLVMHFDQWPRPWQVTPWIGTREQGGFIREIMPHYIQMIMHIFGDITEVHAEIDYPTDPDLSEVGLIAKFRLANGIKVIIDGLVGQAAKERIALTIHGTKQSLSFENWREVKVANRGEDFSSIEPKLQTKQVFSLIDEFCRKMDGHDAFLVDFEEGLQVQSVLEKILSTQK